MKSTMKTVTVAMLVLGVATAAMAQQVPSPRFGGPGGGPIIAGTVQSVDIGKRTITIALRNGDTRTVTLKAGAQIKAARTISVKDLKAGDRVEVHGVATTITADSLTSGDVQGALPRPPAGMNGGGRFQQGGPGFGPMGGRNGFGGGQGPNFGPPQGGQGGQDFGPPPGGPAGFDQNGPGPQDGPDDQNGPPDNRFAQAQGLDDDQGPPQDQQDAAGPPMGGGPNFAWPQQTADGGFGPPPGGRGGFGQGGPGGQDGFGPPQGGPGFRGGPGGFGRGMAGGPNHQPGQMMVTGKVTGTNPLTIALNDDVTLTVKLAPAAKMTEIVTESLSDIKAGDRIIAGGQRGDDGNMAAGRIAINIDPPMGPRPGFGPPGPAR